MELFFECSPKRQISSISFLIDRITLDFEDTLSYPKGVIEYVLGNSSFEGKPMWMNRRSQDLEWMDLGENYYSEAQYHDCLYQLDRIGRFLGGDRASFWALRSLSPPPDSILDIGCGGGLFTLRLAEKFPQAQVTGTDISPQAIAFAEERLKERKFPLPNVRFSIPNSAETGESACCDVVIATLLCHHLADQDIISFLKENCRKARRAVIINDLHRHHLAYLAFALFSPILFPNWMIWHDGLLSIRRSFTRNDWKLLLKATGIDASCYTLTWHWPFRWIISINVEQLKKKKGRDDPL